jgi:8-amino-7-oxononanoate synthase
MTKRQPADAAFRNSTEEDLLHPEDAHAEEQESSSGFGAMRSKLSFHRLVHMWTPTGAPHPLFLCHEGLAKGTTRINGKEYINFATYDYLDINGHPEITAAVTEAAQRYGTTAGASRIVGGERPPHRELERALAEFYGVEDSLVYVSGHATNVSTLGFLMGARDLILHDGLAHNSIVQGCKLSSAHRISYPHNDADELESILVQKRADFKRAMIVTEGLFSMDGNIPDLPRLIELKKKYDCLLMVDEAHSLGVLGATGRGIHEYYGVDPTDVDLWMGTLSKSLCGCGGVIAGSSELVEYLKYGSPGFVFSVGMPPIVAVACNTALSILKREPERVRKIQHISKFFLEYARGKGLDTGAAQGYAVVPVIVGASFAAGYLALSLMEHQIYAMPITFPAVKEGTARLRFFLSAAHTEEDIRHTLDLVVRELPHAIERAALTKTQL